jgi:hypothetical protein
MLFGWAGKREPTPLQIKATAFRDNRSAELVVITALSYDGCKLSSGATFEIGERLRLHLPGQGWIHAEVAGISGSHTRAVFVIECTV